MADDRDFIGRVRFSRDVVISSNPTPIAGYARRAVSGELVTVTAEQDEEAEYLGYQIAVDFECEPIATIEKLRAIWKAGKPIPFRCDEEHGTCILDPKKGLEGLRHETGQNVPVRNVREKYLDLWFGRVNLLVVTGYAGAVDGGLPPNALTTGATGLATNYLTMGYNLQIIVRRNGQIVLCSAGAVSRSADDAAIRWEVTTIAPIPDLSIENDVWDVQFSMAGKTWYSFQDRKADGARGKDTGTDGGVTVSGTVQTIDTDLFNYGTPQTLCFCSPTWLDETFDSWQLNPDGSLSTRDYMQYKGDRLYHPRLPGKQYKAGDFKCIVGPTTHHEVAKYLAQLLGFNVTITTPDMELLDTFTVQSGTNWFEAIKANFTIWGPTIRVEAAVGDGKPTIQVLDVINGDGGMTGIGTVTLQNAAIQSIQYLTAQKGSNTEPVDHVIVTGRNKTDRFYGEFDKEPNYTPVRIPEMSLGINYELTNDMPLDAAWEPITQQLGQSPQQVTFGMDSDAYETSKINKQRVYWGFYRYKDKKSGEDQYVLLRERHDMVNQNGVIEGRVERNHKYGVGYVPINVMETESVRTILPGQSTPKLIPIKWRAVSQQYVVKSIKQAITAEATYELVIYDEVLKDNKRHKDNPNPLGQLKRIDRTRTAIDRSQSTTQRVMGLYTKFRSSFISRTADNVLLKWDWDFDVLSGTSRANSQILKNPKSEDDIVNLHGATPQRWEFYRDGAGKLIGGEMCYKRTVPVSHDDIASDEIAQAIADRIFYRKVEDVKELSVKTSIPIPFGSLPAVVDLVSIPKTVTTAGTSPVLTNANAVDGGRYFVKAVSERFSVGKDIVNPELTIEQTLTLRSRL
ncbi:MAG: hypothetical protein WC505_08105 [Patescibacteria group bacterium]